MNHKQVLVCSLLVVFLMAGAEAKTALDPSVVGVGARVMGMGRSYAAITGSPASIFLNPAALTDLSNWGMTSMYTKLLGEVDYFQLGGENIFDFGILGGGFLGASIGGIQNVVRDPVTGRLTFEAGTTNYYNNIYYLSYGRPIFKELSAGLNFKFYNQGFSGGASGSGYDADLGLLYRPRGDLRVGFVQRNFIPASLGGKIHWNTGAEEALATASRLGVSYNPGVYNLNLDYEFYPTDSSKSGLIKLGAEWWVVPTLAVRAGSDQDISETNLTAGLSVILSGFMFDYAYHQYGSLSQNTTHTFSLSYGIFKGEAAGKKDYIEIVNPKDKSVFFDDLANISGKVLPEVKKLEVGGKEITLSDGGFRFQQPLDLGKNQLALIAYSEQYIQLDEKQLRLLRLTKFKDVPENYWVRIPISVFAMEKIVSGYPDGTFKPEGKITRAEMCSLLMKIISFQGTTSKVKFKDVPAKHWAAKYIAQAVDSGAVKGYPNGTFRPNGPITRAEGVSIVARFLKLPEPKVLEAPFVDVPGRHWAVKEILSAKEAGLLKYLGRNFEPNQKLTRAEVVEILSKTSLLAPKMEAILNFKGGE
ncbi:MAG: S-layer homology domain-containing protein [Candidatus Margulisbacteria bacterium]|nr:S-layer homology domain-containing protein [Candidatus Margulisiibacteriota bacterium]